MGNALLVLASNSPRRRELLSYGGWDFQIRAADVDENLLQKENPASYVLRLAESKARTCAANNFAEVTIVGADTAVVDGEAILGKPKGKAEAVEMLQRLRGRTHQVYTAIAVIRIPNGNLFHDLCVSEVTMRDYRDEEINAYVATGDPLDKAGAYAIQHPKFHPVEKFTGCYASVMGLPLCHLARTLRRVDIAPQNDISSGCQSGLNYICPISAAVLRGEQIG